MSGPAQRFDAKTRAKIAQLYSIHKVSVESLSARYGVRGSTIRRALDTEGVVMDRGHTAMEASD